MPTKDPAQRRAQYEARMLDGREVGYKRRQRLDPEKRAREMATNARHMAVERMLNPEKYLKACRRAKGCIDATGERRCGPCEICGAHSEPLHFDHDHSTGLFRGWLCGSCNRALGCMADDPSRLETAALYLRKKLIG
jgi:Recombination endonuclease VII